MLKLKLQYFGHLMQRADSSEKTLMLRKIEGRKRRGGQIDETVGWHHRHKWAWVWLDSELVMDREAWSTLVHAVTKNCT